MDHIVILAGGKGTRMKSDLPKVLQPVKGIPIIKRLLKNLESVCEKPTIIVGYKGEEVIKATDNKYHYVEQKEQLGTGHALMCTEESLKNHPADTLVVLLGDHPLVTAQTVRNLIDAHKKNGATITMGTAVVVDFTGLNETFNSFGRVIKGADGTVEKIVEHKDATPEERAVREVNLSYYCFDTKWLWENLNKIGNNNVAGEYYLTDIVEIARSQGKKVTTFPIQNIEECLGINTPEQLKVVEDILTIRGE